MAAGRGKARERLAVIDVGSNSVRMVVYEDGGRVPNHMFNEKALCGLGASIEKTRQLDSEGRRRALDALRRYRDLCDRLQVTSIRALATAAVREADDGGDFVREVAEATGIDLQVASGDEEARYAAYGVLSGTPRAKGLVADLGGASLELAEVGGGEVGKTASLPVGPLRLGLPAASGKGAREEVDRQLRGCGLLQRKWPRLYLIGGSWRALARIHMNRIRYPIKVVHEFAMDREDTQALCKWAAGQGEEELRRFSDASASRLAVTPFGAMVLGQLLRAARPRRVSLSAFGLREGVFHDSLSPEVRQQDPLITICREFEARHARFPGYGEELARWVEPLFPDISEREARLLRACCLAGDLEWREHPDYRADIAFETMMRTNLSGVNHAERVFIASALWYRYRGGAAALSVLRNSALIGKRAQQRVRTLGRALRLAEVLTGSATGILRDCPLSLDGKALSLELRPAARTLASAAVKRELQALAAMLERKGRLRVQEN